MGVEVEVVSDTIRYVLVDGKNEDEDKMINDSVGRMLLNLIMYMGRL